MQKGTGFRVFLDILDTQGYAVTGSQAVTAQISKDGGAYTATTNAPATASSTVPQIMSFM